MKQNICFYTSIKLSSCCTTGRVLEKLAWSTYTKDPCFKQLGISYKCDGYSKQTNSYWYNIRFINTSNETIHFSYDAHLNSGEHFFHGRFDVGPGKEYVWVSQSFDTSPSFGTRKDFITYKVTHFLSNVKDDWTLPGFDCDYSTNKWFCSINCEKKSKNENNNENSTNQSESSSNGDIVNDKIAAINVHLNQLSSDDAEAQAIIREAETITSNSRTTDAQKANQLSPLITRAKNRVNSVSAGRKSAEEAEVKAKKEADEKQSNFEKYYEKGMADYQGKNYNSAINNLQMAQNYTVNEQQKAHLNQWIAKIKEDKRLEEEAAARKVRVEEKQKVEAANDAAAASAIAGFGALMALLKDDYTEAPLAIRAQIGLGAENMNLTMIEETTQKETVQSVITANFLLGLNFTLFNNKAISLHLNPYLDYGLVTLQPGNIGNSLKYGGNSMLQLGLRNDSELKIFAEGGYYQRTGNLDYDKDVANGGASATDYITSGSFDYSVLKYGGGLMLHGEADRGEVRIKPGIYFEEFSFAKGKRVMSFNLHANIISQIVIELTYSKNYAIPGGVGNPANFTNANKNYWGFKIIRQGLLTKK